MLENGLASFRRAIRASIDGVDIDRCHDIAVARQPRGNVLVAGMIRCLELARGAIGWECGGAEIRLRIREAANAVVSVQQQHERKRAAAEVFRIPDRAPDIDW